MAMRRSLSYIGLAAGIGLLAIVLSATSAGSAIAQGALKPLEAIIVNTPSVHVREHREPVHFRYQLFSTALSAVLPENQLYEVPAGKRLFITHVSGVAGTPEDVYITAVYLTAGQTSTSFRAFHNFVLSFAVFESSSFNVANISQPIDFVVNAGERVGLQYGRSSAFEGSGTASLILNVSGYLETLP